MAPGQLPPRRPGTTASTPSATTRLRDIAGRRVGGLSCARAECTDPPMSMTKSSIAAFEKFRSRFKFRPVSPFAPIEIQSPSVKRIDESKSRQQLRRLFVPLGSRSPRSCFATEERASRGQREALEVAGRPEDIMPPSDMGGATAATDDVRTAAKARKVRLPRTPDVLFPPRLVPSSTVDRAVLNCR